MTDELNGRLQKNALRILMEHGQMDAEELTKQLGRTNNVVYQTLKSLALKNLLTIGKSCKGQGRRRTVYGLTRLGIERSLKQDAPFA